MKKLGVLCKTKISRCFRAQMKKCSTWKLCNFSRSTTFILCKNSLDQWFWNYFEIRQFFKMQKNATWFLKFATVTLDINLSFMRVEVKNKNMHFNPSWILKLFLLQNYFIKRTLHFSKITKIPLLKNYGLNF